MNESDAAAALDPKDFTDPSPNPARDTELSILCDALQECSVRAVFLTYDGYGDSGALDLVRYEPADALVEERFDRWLRRLAEAYCPEGYENNDGGFGSLAIYPFEGLAEREHQDRYEDTEPAEVPSRQLPRTLRRRLSELGIQHITAPFDGYGDSGQFEEFTVEPQAVVLDAQLRNELEQFLDGRLPGGWEINEGSFGEFAVDVRTGRVTADCSWRVAKESDTETIQWRFRECPTSA